MWVGKALLLVTDFLARLDCVMTMKVGLLTSEEEETFALELALVSGT